MTISLDEMEELARKAAPSPWAYYSNYRGVGSLPRKTGDAYCSIAVVSGVGAGQEKAARNGPYIAACSPETILALTAVVRAARRYEWLKTAQVPPSESHQIETSNAWSALRASLVPFTES